MQLICKMQLIYEMYMHKKRAFKLQIEWEQNACRRGGYRCVYLIHVTYAQRGLYPNFTCTLLKSNGVRGRGEYS